MTSNFFPFFSNRFRAERAAASRRDRTARPNALSRPRRLATEALEDRRLLAASAECVAALNAYVGFGGAFTEENVNAIEIAQDDLSVETLRAAIAQAAATPGDDAIFIRGGGTITFAQTDKAFVVDLDPATQGALTIVGAGGEFVVDAAGVDRAFVVKKGTFNLGDATIKNGAADYGGAIANAGTTTIDSVSILASRATASGGAVASKGAFYAQNSRIEDCVAAVDGAAIYDGDFAFADDPIQLGEPEFDGEIANVAAANGAVVQIDLADYFNDGDWDYSFRCSNDESAIFSAAPTIENGVLTLRFLAQDDYSQTLDLSAVRGTVSAASPTDPSSVATSNEFEIALANQKTATIQAIFSSNSHSQTAALYDVYAEDDVAEDNVLGYGADEIPASERVDFSKPVYLQLWANDAASLWGVESDGLQTFTILVRVKNATLTLPTQTYFGQLSVESTATEGDGYVDYKISIMYKNTSIVGVDSWKILATATATRIDAAQPVSVELLAGTDKRDPLACRRVAGTAEASVVDSSQIALVGCVSDGSTPAATSDAVLLSLSELEDDAALGATANGDATDDDGADDEATTILSNVVVARNAASGNGAIYVGKGRALDVFNATIVDNVAQSAAFFAVVDAENANASGAISVANTIFFANVDAADATVDPINSGTGAFNLADVAQPWAKNFQYDASKPLFVDFANGDYGLAADSQAIDRGSVDGAVDVFYSPLTVDVSGAARGTTPDVGAYERVAIAPATPAAPVDVKLTNYSATDKTIRISWTDVATNETKYVVSARYATSETWKSTEIAADRVGGAFKNVAADRGYVFRVWAENDAGASDYVEITFNASTDVLTAASLSSAAPTVGQALTVSVAPTTALAAFQWFRVDASGAETAIDGATAANYTPTAADVGTYLKVVATGKNAAFDSKINVKTDAAVVDAAVPTAPAAPTNVALVDYDANGGIVSLQWKDASNDETEFVVEMRTNGAEWKTIATPSANATVCAAISVEANDACEFRVCARNAAGSSAWATASFNASTDVLTAANLSSAAPTVGQALTVSVAPTTALAAFQWFRVDASGAETAIDGATAANYTPTAADVGTYLKVVATGKNAAFDSKINVKTDAAVVDAAVPTAPAAPTDLLLSDYDPDAPEISIYWKDASNDETGFVVETRVGDGAWETLAVANADATSALSLAAAPASVRYFRVVATNAGGRSESAEIAFNAATDVLTTLTFSTQTPLVGETLTVSGVPHNDAESYQWIRVDATGAETAIPGATAANYAPTDADAGNYLKVVATGQVGAYLSYVVGQTTSTVAVSTTPTTAPPAAPTDLVFADYNANASTLAARWTDKSDNETGFEIQRRDGDGAWRAVGSVGENATQSAFSSIAGDGSYSFRVRAFNDYVDENGKKVRLYSDWTDASFSAARDVVDEVNLSTDSPLVGQELVASVAEGKEVVYQWFRGADDVFETIDGATGASYKPTDADVGYSIAVVAVCANDAFDSSANAATANAVPETTTSRPVPPTNLTFSQYDSAKKTLTLSWTNASQTATQTVVERRTGDGDWKVVATLAVDAIESVSLKVPETSEYSFRVRAVGATGESVAANATFDARRDVLTSIALSDAPVVGQEIAAVLANAENEATYQWYRVGSDGAATAIDGATESSFVPSDADVGYRLKVVATGQNAAFFSQVDATSDAVSGPAAPAAPTDAALDGYDAATGKVRLTWNDNSNDETGFLVQTSVDGGKTWRDVASLEYDATSLTCRGLVEGTTQSFRVAAFNDVGVSDWTVADLQIPSAARSDAPLVEFAPLDLEDDGETAAILAEGIVSDAANDNRDDENDDDFPSFVDFV